MKPLDALRTIRESSLPSTEKLVLIAMVLRANKSGTTWVGQATLAEDTSLSVKSVKRARTSLMSRGVVESVKRAGTSSVYSIHLNGLPSREVGTESPQSPEGGGDTVTPGGDRESPVVGTESPHSGDRESPDLPTNCPTDLPNSDPLPLVLMPPEDERTETEKVMEAVREYRPRRKAIPKGLEARIKDHGVEAALLVVHWVFTSSHSRADHLREGGYTMDTPWRPSKFEVYLEMAEEWDKAGRPANGHNGKPAPDIGPLLMRLSEGAIEFGRPWMRDEELDRVLHEIVRPHWTELGEDKFRAQQARRTIQSQWEEHHR